MSETPNDMLIAARTNIRDTVKWLIAALAAVAAAVVGTGSLTGLGQIQSLERLHLAITSAGIGLFCVLIAIFLAVRLLVTKPFFFADLRGDESMNAFVAKHAVDLFPPELPSLHDLGGALDERRERLKAMAPGAEKDQEAVAYRTLLGIVQGVMRPVLFELERRRFQMLGLQLFVLSAFAIVALGTFAWAASPPKDKEMTQVICTVPGKAAPDGTPPP